MKKWFCVALLVVVPLSLPAAQQELKIYNWSDYIDPGVIAQFEQQTGIKVTLDTYDSNEQMFDRLKSTPQSGYDVAFPSTYYLDRMSHLGMLQSLDHARLPNLVHMNKALLNKDYDRNNTYSVPYMWGSTAIGVNARHVNAASITSWNDLWNPSFKGRVFLMDDVREVFGMALRSLGYSGNDTDPEHIRLAYEKLQKLMPNVKVIDSESPGEFFLNDEVDIGLIWGSEVFIANEKSPDIKYVYPKEGALFWVDSIVIPRGATNIENAHRFMDFMMKPGIAKTNGEYTGCASANQSATDMLDEKMQTLATVYPQPNDLVRGEFQTDVHEALSLYEKYWELLKKQVKR